MTYLSGIRLNNFHGLSLNLDLTSPRGDPVKQFVIAGPNGTGKTRVLSALRCFLDDETPRSGTSVELLFRRDSQEALPSFEAISEERDLFVPRPSTGDLLPPALVEFWRVARHDGSTLEITHRPGFESCRPYFGVRRGGRVFLPSELGAGDRDLLHMATVLTRERDLVLIDTPERYLSAEQRTAFLPALRALAPQSQIILATKAPEIWDQVMSFERVLLLHAGDPRGGR